MSPAPAAAAEAGTTVRPFETRPPVRQSVSPSVRPSTRSRDQTEQPPGAAGSRITITCLPLTRNRLPESPSHLGNPTAESDEVGVSGITHTHTYAGTYCFCSCSCQCLSSCLPTSECQKRRPEDRVRCDYDVGVHTHTHTPYTHTYTCIIYVQPVRNRIRRKINK